MSEDLKTVTDDLDFSTNRIGEQTRAISLGVLAIAWLFLAGGSNAPAVKVAPEASVLLAAGGLAIGSLLADYFQYLFAYVSSVGVLKQAEANPGAKPEYDYSALTYRARKFFFWVKQVLCLLATGVLVVAVVRALIGA
jgi:hypothetical protein